MNSAAGDAASRRHRGAVCTKRSADEPSQILRSGVHGDNLALERLISDIGAPFLST
jgi:predicted deacylase